MTMVRLEGFHMQRQLETHWCWAAVSASVNEFYGGAMAWGQCEIATTCLGMACCQFPDPCDAPHTLEHPLSVVGHLVNHDLGPITWWRIVECIDNGQAICCHINWNGGGGHFVAIVGYDPATGDVLIEDPARGGDTVPLASFTQSYDDKGQWDYTYFTAPNAGGAP